MGGRRPKAFLSLAGKPMFAYSLHTIAGLPSVDSLVLVVPSDWLHETRNLLASEPRCRIPVHVTAGGEERQDSVAAGLACVREAEFVLVHDAARPFASAALFSACIDGALRSGAAVAALPASDTVKLAAAGGTIQQTLDRSMVWLAQTPQVFGAQLLRRAFELARRDGFRGTDEATLVERLGIDVSLIPGETTNRKLTTPDDLDWAQWYLSRQ